MSPTQPIPKFSSGVIEASTCLSEISTGISIHISVYPITKFKILIYTKSEKLIYI